MHDGCILRDDIYHKPSLYCVRKIFGGDIKWHVGSKRSTVGFPVGVTDRNTTQCTGHTTNFQSQRAAPRRQLHHQTSLVQSLDATPLL
jgi:hypothetical protein